MNKYLLSIWLILAAIYHGWLTELQAEHAAVKEQTNLCQQQPAAAENKPALL